MPVKMWHGWSSVQTRLTGVMVVAGIFAVLALVLSRTNETRRMDAYLAADAKEHGELLDHTVEMDGASLAMFTSDYARWGEMVQFVQTGDRTWASVNIDVGISTYQANAAWVFDTAGAPVYAVRDSTLEALFEPLPPGLSVKDEFGDGHFCHFFIAGPDGPVEIRGATIVPSEDDERLTPARGYFLVARSWNRQHLAELSRLTGKTVQIEPAHGRTKPSAEIARQSGEITFTRPLPGPQGKPGLMLTALLRPEWITVARRSSSDLSVQMAGLALLGVLGLTMALWLWVTRPLGQIRRSLESGSTEALKPLERSRTEFGQLAQLVDQSFGQNAALVKEVTERKQAEQTLRGSEERFRELFESMSSGVAVYETRDQGASFIFKSLNRGGQRIDSLRREEVVGRSVQQVFPRIEEFGLLAVLRRVWQTGRPERHPVGRYEDDRISGWRENYVYKLPSGEVVAVYDDVTVRVLAEAALRESEERYRKTIDALPEAVFESGPDGRLTLVNQSGMAAFGLTEADVARGVNVLQLLVPEDRERAAADTRRVMGGESRPGTEYTAMRKDGSRFTAIVHAGRILRDGKPVGLRGILIDISVRKLTEQTLRESEEKYRLVVDNADEAILVAQDGKLVFTNPRTSELLGYPREGLFGRSITDFIHPDDCALVADRYRRRVAGEDIPVGYDFRVVRRDGETRHVEINATRIDWLGRPATLNFLADITERKRTETALRESEEKFRGMFDAAWDGMVLADVETGRFVIANGAFSNMVGYGPEEVLRLSMPDIHPSDSLAHVKESFDRMVAGEISLAPDIPVKRKDGSVFHADVSAAAITLGGRNLLMGVFRDTTERGRAEGEARRHAELQAAINEMLRVSLEDLPLDSILEKSLGIITAIPWLVLDLRGSIHLVEDDPQVLVMKAQRGLANSLLVMCDRVRFGRCLCGRAASTGQLVFSDHVDDSHENRYDGIRDHGHYCVPMLSADQRVLGVLNLYFAAGGKRNKETEELLGVVANVLAGVVQRKRAEEDVKLKAELLDAGTDSIFLHDPAGMFLYANESSYKTRGYSKEEFLALNLRDINVPEQAARIEQRIAELQRNGESTFESDEFRRDRSVMPVEVHARMLKVGGRELILSVVRDITERKRTETELRESELKFRAIFDGASDGMFLIEQESRRFALANSSCLRMLGYSADEFANLSIADLHPEEDLHFVLEQIGAFMKGETGGRGEVQFKRKDGSLFPADPSPAGVMLGDKKCILIMFSDITERKLAEAEIAEKNTELVELNNVKNQLLGMASHDLRNPLSVISTASTFLLDDASRNLPEAKRAEFMRRINSSSKFMLKLIDDLLDVAKIEAGRLDLHLKEEDLCSLIEDTLTLNRVLADKKSIRLDFTPECGLPPLRLDRSKVEQVLNNLVSNALKFSAPGTAVTVQASRVHGSVVVSVRDQGQGIPAEELDKLFKPFGKTSVRATAGESSTGLGLAICRKIVEGHHGRIWAESEVGKGSVFSFSLPVAEPA